ncbi:MAG: hypothetical protein RLZZ584_1040 [Pseudomonadota bacterium]
MVELTDQLAQARTLVDAELARHPTRPARLVLRPNGELLEGADTAAGALSPATATATADDNTGGTTPASPGPYTDAGTTPDNAAAAQAASPPGVRTTTVSDHGGAAPDATPPAARAQHHQPDEHAGDAAHEHLDAGPARRRAAGRRLLATLEALQPLLREHDLVPRELLEHLERHTEAWAILLDPRAPAGTPGSMADAAEVIDALALLGEQLDAYDYPQAEQALQHALQQMRTRHA